MVPWWLSSSTHTFYKHRRDSSVNLVQLTVSHLSTMSHCHCTGWKQPQLIDSLTVWHHFYLLRAEGVVRGREGQNERKGHRKGHWKEQWKGEDERKGGIEWDRRGRERERLEKETERGRDTDTDSGGEGRYVSSSSTETSMQSRPHRKVLDQTQSHHQALNWYMYWPSSAVNMTDQPVNEEEINQILAIVNLLTMFFFTQLDNTEPRLGQIHTY